MSKTITLEEFSANPTSVIEELKDTREAIILTSNGEPTAVLTPFETRRLTVDELRAEVLRADAEGEADLGVPLDEARRILAAKWAERGE